MGRLKLSFPEVFIIESLDFDDEREERFEGKMISQALRMMEKEYSNYYYIRTEKELLSVLKKFKKSRSRYLHISCHASKYKIHLTLDSFSKSEFGEILAPYLKKKRLFVSACGASTRSLARPIITNGKGYSVIGPKDDIYFSNSTAFWIAFYTAIFERNEDMIMKAGIIQCLKHLNGLFEDPMNYFQSTAEHSKTKLIDLNDYDFEGKRIKNT